jgi:hypothetical protein
LIQCWILKSLSQFFYRLGLHRCILLFKSITLQALLQFHYRKGLNRYSVFVSDICVRNRSWSVTSCLCSEAWKWRAWQIIDLRIFILKLSFLLWESDIYHHDANSNNCWKNILYEQAIVWEIIIPSVIILVYIKVICSFKYKLFDNPVACPQ